MKTNATYQPAKEEDTGLAKRMGIIDYFAVGFGSIIGVGWVIMVGDWIDIGGGVIAPIIAFVIGALALLPIALVYGGLVVDMPVAGGAIAYTLNAYGSLTSYLTGWFLALGYIMMCPWEAIVIGEIIQAIFPGLKAFPLYSIGEYTLYSPTLIISLLICVVIIIINYRGIEYVTKIQNLLVILLIIVNIVAVLISATAGSFQNILPLVAHSPQNPNGSFVSGLFSILAITPFFYAGFDTIPQGIEECSASISSKKISKTIFISIVTACMFYIFIIFAVSAIMPWREIIGLNIPAADAYKVGLGLPIMSKLILVGALCGLITTLNSFFVAGARVLLTLGRARFLSELFSRIHPVYKTPYTANIIIAIITLAGPFVGKTLLLPIINICSFGFMLAWLMVCLSSVKLKKADYPWLQYLSIGFSVLMILLLVIPASPGALKWPLEWGLIAAWAVIGGIIYIISKWEKPLISLQERQKQVMGEFYHRGKGI